MKLAFAILLVVLTVNAASAQTLASGSTVCESKNMILSVQEAIDDGDARKHEELLASGRCSIVKGDRHIAVTKTCKGEARKIIMDGTPYWCLTRNIR